MTPLTLNAALLWSLSSGPGFGAELMERVRLLGVEPKNASVYPALHELAMHQFVTTWEEPNANGGRPRRFYKLTKLGRAAAKSSLAKVRAALVALESMKEAA